MTAPLRIVGWFSAGAASAVAIRIAKVATETPEHPYYGLPLVIAYIDTGSEHPDNERFRQECEEWLGQEIIVLKSPEYEDIYDVFDRTGYLVGPGGARCTTELKKKVRWAFQRPDDVQVFGYTADTQDAKRATRFTDQNPEATGWFPLVENRLTKGSCLALIDRVGIELPEMYRLGYRNNNCLGCVKGGQGYWNKIRVDFPDVFEKMARQERKMGRTVLRERVPDGEPYEAPCDPEIAPGETVTVVPTKSVPLWLDELDPNRGNYKAEVMGCDLDCSTVAESWVEVSIGGVA